MTAPEASGAAEGGEAAFGGDAGSGEDEEAILWGELHEEWIAPLRGTNSSCQCRVGSVCPSRRLGLAMLGFGLR